MSGSKGFMNSKVVLNFEDPKTVHDRVLIVGGRKFHVVAQTLAFWSEHFSGMFNGEFSDASQNEIELFDLDSDLFAIFLKMIYYSASVTLKDDEIVPLIEMSYRFLAPIVFEQCENYVEKNINNMGYITLQLLEVACIHGCDGLRVKMIDQLSKTDVIANFSCFEILEIADQHKLDNLKNQTVDYMSSQLTVENYSEFLDCCEKFYLGELKDKLIRALYEWNWNTIPTKRIISLTKCAFKHDIYMLKSKVRRNIYFLVEQEDSTIHTIRKKDNKEGNAPITANWFVRDNLDELMSLPSDICEFLIMSAFTQYL